MSRRVLVAMSGGVDSSAAAALLVDQGFEVIGVTMQVWDYSQCSSSEGIGSCCSSLDVEDARAVASKLEIPFYVINCEEKFQTHVINPFINSYLKGLTPSPCIHCNTFLKFDHLINKMKELECDFLATGHYAINLKTDQGYQIYTSGDSWKDQTYFLFTIDPKILPQILFPIGKMKKEDVRLYAEKKGLLNSKKKDSTGICFVGNLGYASFIESRLPNAKFKEGLILHYPSGKVLAPHQGIHHFTYGQRKGLGISSNEPLYVLKIDSQKNEVWVGEESYLFDFQMKIERVHWLDSVKNEEKLKTKIRFHHQGAMAKIEFDREMEDVVHVQFDEPQRAITPGQAAVFYKNDQLIGGGWIL